MLFMYIISRKLDFPCRLGRYTQEQIRAQSGSFHHLYQHPRIMHRVNRHSTRPLAATNFERPNNRTEAVHQRMGPLKQTNEGPFREWQSKKEPGTTAVTPISPIIEDNGAPAVKPLKATAFDTDQGHIARVATTQSQFNTITRFSNSRVSVSPPSAAATARRNLYEPPAKRQSVFKAESLPFRNRAPSDARATQNVKMPKENFKAGMIIRALIHEPSYSGPSGASSVTLADRYITESKFGIICSKYRKMIIIATYQDHYLALPIYTHNGRGLTFKSKPDEYVSVQDHRQSEPFTALSAHRPLLTQFLNPGIDPYDPKSTVHITYSVSRNYKLPVVHEGYLAPEATDQLVKLVSA